MSRLVDVILEDIDNVLADAEQLWFAELRQRLARYAAATPGLTTDAEPVGPDGATRFDAWEALGWTPQAGEL